MITGTALRFILILVGSLNFGFGVYGLTQNPYVSVSFTLALMCSLAALRPNDKSDEEYEEEGGGGIDQI